MKMIRKSFAFTATALPILAFALTPSAASAQNFTGTYPVSVTQTLCGIAGNIKCGSSSYCLKLTDDRSFGRPDSGPATLESFNSPSLFGTFEVIGNTIMTTFQTSGNGTSSGVVIAAPASARTGQIGIGIYDLVVAGESEASGLATFGVKNGC